MLLCITVCFSAEPSSKLPCLYILWIYRNWLDRICLLQIDTETESGFRFENRNGFRQMDHTLSVLKYLFIIIIILQKKGVMQTNRLQIAVRHLQAYSSASLLSLKIINICRFWSQRKAVLLAWLCYLAWHVASTSQLPCEVNKLT